MMDSEKLAEDVEEDCSMDLETIENTIDAIEWERNAVAIVTECCAEAEKLFSTGEISLIDLYKVYEKAREDFKLEYADTKYGSWSHIYWRGRRLQRLISGQHECKAVTN